MLYLRGGDDQAKSDWWSWNCARGYQVTQVLRDYHIIINIISFCKKILSYHFVKKSAPTPYSKRESVVQKAKSEAITASAVLLILLMSHSDYHCFQFFLVPRIGQILTCFFNFNRLRFRLAGFWSFEDYFSLQGREREHKCRDFNNPIYRGQCFHLINVDLLAHFTGEKGKGGVFV